MPPTDVAVHRSFRDPVLAVWPYWSRPELLERWLGTADLELEAGGLFQASLWNGDQVRASVIAAAPPNRLDLAWCGEGPDAPTTVRIRLEHQGPGCRVAIEQADPGSDAERSHACGWWSEALDALRAAMNGGTDAHRWGDSLPIVLRAPLARGAADIWPLLSTAAGLEKWLASAERFDAAPGGAFRFVSQFKGTEIVEEGRVEAMEPERLVALSWEWMGQGWQAPTRVELRLEPDPSGTALVIRHSGFEGLAPEQRLAARLNYTAGWRDVMQDLKRLVAPGPTG
jgi:uncharacterized protein YndB with AHSA1/START domain